MISSDSIRGFNDIIILGILKEAPSYGYGISKKISDRTDKNYVIKETTLYSAFKRLEISGYISSFSDRRENGKLRTYYKLTDKGAKYYEDKRAEWHLIKKVIDKFI